jgi:hypothetical protein
MANSLLSQIENIINSYVMSYNLKIAKKYNIDVSELNELWASRDIDNESQNSESSQIVVKKVQARSPPAPKSQDKTCPYNFTRGPNAGSVCGTKIKGEGSYCSKHKQYEAKEQKPKKVLPQPKKNTSSEDDAEEEEKVREELNKKKTEGFSQKEINYMFFKKPELGENLSYHKQTGFVCNEEKLIVGKKNEQNKVIPLTEEDIKVAKSWNFNIKQVENKSESKVEVPEPVKVVNIVKPPVITRGVQESKVVENAPKKLSSSVKKFVVPVAKLTTTKIEKTNLPVKETTEVVQTKQIVKPQSLNEEAKNTKKTIANIIEKQKEDLEDILQDLTKGEEDGVSDGEEHSDNSDDEILEEDEILEDDD